MKSGPNFPALRRFAAASLLCALASLLLASCSSTSERYNEDGYASKFGVMGISQDGKFRVYAETDQIHRLTDENYVHGFEVVRKDGSRFMGQYRIRFPEPIRITPDIEKAYDVSEGGLVIESEPEIQWGIFSVPFRFSEDDPLGVYELTIIIDGEPYRTILYEVVPFGHGEA